MKVKKLNIKNIIGSMKYRIQKDEVPALGAQLTYYLILSFFPFLIFLLTLLSHTSISASDVVNNLSGVLPEQSFSLITDTIEEVLQNGSTSLLSFSIIGTLWSASSGVAALIKGLNKAYDQEENRPFLLLRGFAILITIALVIGIVLAFTLLVFGEIIGNYIFSLFNLTEVFKQFWDTIRFVFPIIMLIIVFTLFYKYAPNKKRLKLKEVLPGALFTTAAWIGISLLFSFYVNNFGNYTKTYGSIGGIIILLIWLYISSIIILIGGELNATLAFDRISIIKQIKDKK
ncbi:YihY/virulence factor BrkB family protein [Senegalia massiliensis]|uniref:YihY/virulence factor BrkB family protein n=1 Tax=Senegalia massiliensis TaxID=1720316 RepID=UPI001A910BB6|nr:YihY/virulence factor BrkB family protein [Senegalia massiliensis]